MASLEEVSFDLARQALTEQEGVARDVRTRTGPLLASAAAVAGLLARPAIEHASRPQAALALIGFAGGLTALFAAMSVLRSRMVGFSVDSEGLYQAAWNDRDKPSVYYRRLAETFRSRRMLNDPDVAKLHWLYSLGLAGLTVEVIGLTVAVAVS